MSKVLIVEDEVDTAKVLEKRVTDQGYDVAVAYDAYSGIAFIHKESPDLILLDLMLPAGGGMSVLRHVRLSTHVSHVPVIVITASGDAKHKKMANDLGIDGYIEKPYDPENLMSTIKNILDKKEK